MNEGSGTVDAPIDSAATPARASAVPAAAAPAGWRRVLGFLPEVSAVLVTAWIFRAVARQGLLPGNIGDARWTLGLHEHWYRVWTGQDAIRDLAYYFPLKNTLGSSDAFLVQGQLYSLARLVGVDPLTSWLFAGVTFFLVGALGVAVLSRRLLDSPWLQSAMVVLTVASYPMLAQLDHVQLFGMLSVSWIFVGLADVIGRRHVRRGVALLVLVPPLLALSSWYALMLAAVVLGFLGLALLLLSSGSGIARAVRQVAGDLWGTLRSVPGVVLAVLFVVLWVGVLWVYLPSRGLLPKSGWTDVIAYSPRWSDIWNASFGGGGLWSGLYARVPEFALSNNEQQLGFPPVLFVAFVAAGLAVLRSSVLGRSTSPADPADPVTLEPAGSAGAQGVGRVGLLASCLTVVAVLAFLLMDDRGLSFFRLAWVHIPGFEAVRAPFRVMSVLAGIAVVVILRAIELRWRRSARLRQVRWGRAVVATGTGLLVLLMFAEAQRTAYSTWTRADLLPAQLQAQIEPARAACDAVILLDDDPSAPPWKNPIDAVVFSVLSGLPTPQGYSRADPLDYPGQVGQSDGTALAQWMRAKGFAGRICAVSAQGVRELPA
ncbi:hypothetical protein [Nakamurella sp.]|uniref:hypothetical protein n=1 Tax=Nakamurella sp. TaxID=1869182 RepID=UPI003B3A99FA